MPKPKKHTRKFPLGIIILLIVFIYLSYHTVSYFTRDKVSSYEIGNVTSLSANKSCTGLIVRDESVITSACSGDIFLLLKNGTRVSKDEKICLVDETGSFASYVQSEYGQNLLNASEYEELAGDVRNFSLNYNSKDFSRVYDFKNSAVNYINGISNIYCVGLSGSLSHYCSAANAGIVEYYLDGFEELETSAICADSFNKSAYTRSDLLSGAKVSAGEGLFKLINSEEWSIVIPLSDEDILQFADQKRVKILFDDTGQTSTVLFETFTGSDGAIYGKLTTTKYMIRYADERYIKITLLSDAPEGLKLPKSALTEAELYKIPIEYLTNGGGIDEEGFLLEESTAAGSSFISPSFTYKDDYFIYISLDQLSSGARLIKPVSDERYQIGATEKLTGVYNINKGYAAFKAVTVLDSDDNYVIVQEGTYSGIKAQDYILLNGSEGYQNRIIYQ